jgi:hypothetical protein
MMINNNNDNSRAKSKRIVTLQTRIKWIEGHYYPSIRNNKNEEIKILKAELADLLKADAEYDKFRNIPLYCCKITGWKFVCSDCFKKISNHRRRN